ncbi:hypothetical protein SUGI_0965380 [Cryptomeria japonica]|nr:hypothetical protein SUGI_0965380 [Cryptomeria japonica]
MQVAGNRGLQRAIRSPFLFSVQTILTSKSAQDYEQLNVVRSFGAFVQGNNTPGGVCQYAGQYLVNRRMQRFLSTEVEKPNSNPTEAVQELYQKIIESLDSKNLPPNTLRDSFLEKCKNTEDVKLVFELLEKLRIFKTAGLCQHANWPKQITRAVASACIRAKAPEIGLKTLWRHNVYGLTPDIGAAHILLLYSREKKNIVLMNKILETVKKNVLKAHPKTADIVLSICNDTKKWSSMIIHAKKFLDDGVKLHPGAYDKLISCAAKFGKTENILRVQELLAASGFMQTVPSTFVCAKAYLLKQQPQEAAKVIFKFNQENQSETKKSAVYQELELLVDQWPEVVIVKQAKVDRKAFSSKLKDCISKMFNHLQNMGFEVSLNVDERRNKSFKKHLGD